VRGTSTFRAEYFDIAPQADVVIHTRPTHDYQTQRTIMTSDEIRLLPDPIQRGSGLLAAGGDGGTAAYESDGML